ncbi:hypothetical protein ACFOY4_01095 [Actinomadura syzygii]|nr:hypothetical protein [Actinomadura syzygii]
MRPDDTGIGPVAAGLVERGPSPTSGARLWCVVAHIPVREVAR